MNNELKSRIRFNPTISFDGVAIILACIYCALWFGSLSQTIKDHTETLRRHDAMLQTLAEGQKIQAENLSVLSTIVNERTKK